MVFPAASYYYGVMVTLKIDTPPSPNRDKYPFVASTNYKGLNIDIENLAGSIREGTDANGKKWKTEFKRAHYGEIRGSKGVDGDPLDVYLAAEPTDSNIAYIIHQNHPGNHPDKAGQWDEDKVVLGVTSPEAAKELYLQHYNRKDFFRSVTIMPMDKFKKYIFGENKGEKVAQEVDLVKGLVAILDDMPGLVARLRAIEEQKKGNSFIRTKLREGVPMYKESALNEAYRAGVLTALNEFVKHAAPPGWQVEQLKNMGYVSKDSPLLQHGQKQVPLSQIMQKKPLFDAGLLKKNLTPGPGFQSPQKTPPVMVAKETPRKVMPTPTKKVAPPAPMPVSKQAPVQIAQAPVKK